MPILNDIIDWVHNRPVFWQVAIDRLIRNNELTNDDISELKEICKVDFGLSDFDFDKVNFDDLRKFANNTTSNDDITLSKISPPTGPRLYRGLNALGICNALLPTFPS